ncbi:alpha/beta hydrolase [Alphaproteobacteria bacterium]|nr:alpha/beta hydrolase [Alphaproteobacteria bacterium]
MLQFKTPELKYLSYRQGQIAYRETGTGQTLFFLHGMNGNSKSWENLFYSLSSSFRVVAWDAPSFGGSDVFGDNIEEYKNAAKALIETLKLKKIILIGHSMGGLIASQLAYDNDVSVSGLILSSTHLGFGCKKGEPLMERYANRLKTFSTKLSDIDYAMERAKRNTPEGTSETVIKFLANVALDIRKESIRDGGRMSQEADNTNICKDLKVPVLILSGGKDTVISTEMHASLIAALPRAHKVVFPKAGHASFAEYPDQFNYQVTEFAKKVWNLNETVLNKL